MQVHHCLIFIRSNILYIAGLHCSKLYILIVRADDEHLFNQAQYGHEESNKSVEDGDVTFAGW